MRSRALLVEPDPQLLTSLQQSLTPLAQIDACTNFSQARRMLLARRLYAHLFTNLRLNEYNGLHLVYLVDRSTRCVVYSDRDDAVLMEEVQSAHAFYESRARAHLTLAGYLQHPLPP